MQTIFIAALAAHQHTSSSSARRVDVAFYPSDKCTYFKASLILRVSILQQAFCNRYVDLSWSWVQFRSPKGFCPTLHFLLGAKLSCSLCSEHSWDVASTYLLLCASTSFWASIWYKKRTYSWVHFLSWSVKMCDSINFHREQWSHGWSMFIELSVPTKQHIKH